jgi:excinuclease UvrABC nuclease subunit
MPFPLDSFPRSWNIKNIEEIRPGVPGIYGITTSHFVFIYIGKANDLREQLLQHFKFASVQAQCIANNGPAFFYIATDFYVNDQEEASLIREFVPICNNTQSKKGILIDDYTAKRRRSGG